MVKAPQKQEGPGKPKIFLLLAAIFVGMAVTGYVYEDELYIYRPYREIVFHDINVYFIGIIMFSLIGAFFCLFCFLNPRVGNKILGRQDAKATLPKEKIGTVTYSVFADTTAKSVKAQHRARKSARHARHKYGKGEKVQKVKKED